MHSRKPKLNQLKMIALLSCCLPIGAAQATDLLTKPNPTPVLSALGNKAELVDIGEMEVFVRLAEQPVVGWRNARVEAGAEAPDSEAQKNYAAALSQQLEVLSGQLSAMGATELSRLRVGDNGIRVKVDMSQLDQIRGLTGVVAVTKVTQYTPDLTKSVPWIGASAVQSSGNSGEGVSIAIIDSGVDYLHANFGGSGDPFEYAANDKNVIEPGTFPTARVIGGYDFAGPTYDARDPLLVPIPDADPLDVGGHGSHVAGIAAGSGVPGVIGIGVAPEASIVALKVFGDAGGSTSLVSDAIEYALDPNGDGDTSDHVDVINMSLGSFYGSPDDPSAVASQNAADMGIVVVASAGNDGPIPYITGSPAVGQSVVSVASSLSGGETTGIDVNGTSYESVEGAGPVLIADGAITGNLAIPSDGANAAGCNPITDDFSNQVAFIIRGGCDFNVKYLNAQAAGATAIVVYNDGTAPDRVAPIIMGGVSAAATIPGTMISSFDGIAIVNDLTGSPQIATLDAAISAQGNFGDTISSFSSLGPARGGSGFKPDITAPGSAIVSAGVGTGAGPLTLGGTSMSAPHVAGVSALLLAENPELTPEGVKAILQNSTVAAVPDGTIGPAQALSRQGTGVVRADKAVTLTSYATPGGVSFGRVNPDKNTRRKVDVKLVNLSEDFRSYSVTHIPNQSFPGVEVQCPRTVHIAGDRHSHKHSSKSRKHSSKGKYAKNRHGKSHKHYTKSKNYRGKWASNKLTSKNVEIKLKMDPSVGPYDDAFNSQVEVDGWCVFDDGIDQLRVGYTAVVDPASNMKVRSEDAMVTINNRGASVGWAEGFTLAAEDGLLLDDSFNAIKAIGYRSNSYAALGDLIEFGIASEKIWESFATAEIDIFIDVDHDGVDDAILVVADFNEDGLPITAVFPQGAGLFSAGVDYNDGAAVLTFFSKLDAPLGPNFGFLPAGDTDFDFTVVFFDITTGEYDVQFGTIDLANEVIPAASTFGLAPDDSATLPVSGSGDMLWLFQNNEAKKGRTGRQAQVVSVPVAGN